MRVLDRYVIKSVISIFLVCLFTFLFLYVIIDALTHLEDILKQQVSLNILIEYYLSYLPIIFVQVAPFSCLLATLYTFAKLNRENEIIAMRASGLSIFGITKTVIIFGFVTSIFVFWINDRVVPQAQALNEKIKYQMENRINIPDKDKETITNLSVYGMGNRLFFVNKFIPSTKTMEGIIILEQDHHQNITRKIVANKGIYKNNSWFFYQTVSYDFDLNGQMIGDPRYTQEEIVPIPESPQEFLTQKQHPDVMTISQLNDYIWKLSRSGATTVVRNLKVDLYQRYTSPLINLIMILLAVPFSFRLKKRATGLSSLGVSIIIAFLYYVLNAVSIALGKGGILPPVISASLSHIIILSSSLYMILNLP